jgi:hypothetical protein
MVRWFRRWAILTAPLALVIASMVAIGTMDWWHPEDDDTPTAAFHDHSAHHPVFGAAPTKTHAAEHCYLCHWLRTLSNGLRSVAQYRIAQITDRPVLQSADCRITQLVASTLPARAPPA